MKKLRDGVTVVLDAQAGSCGKGKFIGYIAQKYNPDISICNFMSNAGHTYCDDHRHIMTQQLPTSIVNPNTIICIGAESAITPIILFKEIMEYKHIIGNRRVYVHPNAVVITQSHRRYEETMLRSGSTFKGCGAARADKVMRHAMLFGEFWRKLQNTEFDDDNEFAYVCTCGEYDILKDTIVVKDMTMVIDDKMRHGGSVLIEGSQGCDLDINFGLPYPHVTSRQCHAGQLTADCGISPRCVGDIIMIMRPYPIRISNTTNIRQHGRELEVSSGDYGESEEITWEEVRKRCGAPHNIDFGEKTTVTKKTRRVFEMNWDRMDYVVCLNRPTMIALNFAQYLDWNIFHKKSEEDIQRCQKVRDFIDNVEKRYNIPVAFVGTGAENEYIIDRSWWR